MKNGNDKAMQNINKNSHRTKIIDFLHRICIALPSLASANSEFPQRSDHTETSDRSRPRMRDERAMHQRQGVREQRMREPVQGQPVRSQRHLLRPEPRSGLQVSTRAHWQPHAQLLPK